MLSRQSAMSALGHALKPACFGAHWAASAHVPSLDMRGNSVPSKRNLLDKASSAQSLDEIV